jgi:uncharacterized membrane protein (DUF485 family)
MPSIPYIFLGVLLATLVQLSSFFIYLKTKQKALALLPTVIFFLIGVTLSLIVYLIALLETTALAWLALTSIITITLITTIISLITSLLVLTVVDLKAKINHKEKK